MREDVDRFRARGAQIVAIAPEGLDAVLRYRESRSFPFPMLPDPDLTVFDAYDVVSKMMSLGQRPAVFVIGSDGIVRFDSIGSQQWQIPSDDTILAAIPST